MRALVIAALIYSSGCHGLTPTPPESVSFGTTSSGSIRGRGVALPDRGPGFERARPGEATRYGTPRFVAALQRAFAEVDARFPATAPVRVGDLSSPFGGRHPRHRSHRTGRDADILFYVTDATGRSRSARGWLAYNRHGYAIERESVSDTPPFGLFFLDDARNWHLVRTLLLDDDAAVQWIFCSRGVKARLLSYGIAHEEDSRALWRAAYVLQQPARAAPHDDHFHVRVLCGPEEVGAGCVNVGPMWPWLRDRYEKAPSGPEPTLDDARALAELADSIE